MENILKQSEKITDDWKSYKKLKLGRAIPNSQSEKEGNNGET